MLTFPSCTYTGTFKNNLFDGLGCNLTSSDGTSYTGGFRLGKYHGIGRITSPDGTNFTGEFAEGKKNGVGKLHQKDGYTYVGGWKHDTKHGEGTETLHTGSTRVGVWKQGNLLNTMSWNKIFDEHFSEITDYGESLLSSFEIAQSESEDLCLFACSVTSALTLELKNVPKEDLDALSDTHLIKKTRNEEVSRSILLMNQCNLETEFNTKPIQKVVSRGNQQALKSVVTEETEESTLQSESILNAKMNSFLSANNSLENSVSFTYYDGDETGIGTIDALKCYRADGNTHSSNIY